MARQVTSKFTGTKAGLTFYKMYNSFYVRTKSRAGIQTSGTRARQKDFALAASLSACIRSMLAPAIPNPKQKTMQNRLTKAIMQWVLTNPLQCNQNTSVGMLNGFHFTAEPSFLQNIFKEQVTNAGPGNGLQITIPAFKPVQVIKAPPGTKQVQLTIAAGCCTMAPVKPMQCAYEQLTIRYNNKLKEQQSVNLPAAEKNTLTVIAVAVSCWVKQPGSTALLQVKQKTWSPAAIVYAALN